MFEIFGFIIPLIVILVIVGIFLSFVPLGLWISAVSAGVRVNIFSLVGMRLRRVRADKIIRPAYKSVAEKRIYQPIDKRQERELAGGNYRKIEEK